MSSDRRDETARRLPSVPRLGVGVLVKDGDRFVLVRRGREPAKGRWAVPGGMIEVGERIEEAARREILEECGLKIDRLRFLTVYEFIQKEAQDVLYHMVVLEYCADYVEGVLKAGDDAEAVGWFCEKDLETLDCSETVREVVRLALVGA